MNVFFFRIVNLSARTSCRASHAQPNTVLPAAQAAAPKVVRAMAPYMSYC